MPERFSTCTLRLLRSAYQSCGWAYQIYLFILCRCTHHSHFGGKTIKRLTVFVLLVFLISSPAIAQEGLHYQYSTQDNQSLDYWFSEQGVRISSEGGSARTLIYRPDDDSIITLNPEDQEAVILNRQQIKQLIQKIKQIFKRMESLPPQQRKMMKRAMGGAMGKIKDAADIKSPKLVRSEAVDWQGQSAKRGVLITDNDTSGTAIILDEPPVSIGEGERQTFQKFKDFFIDILRISSSVSQSLDVTEAINKAQSLLGKMQFRLAEFHSPDRSLTLTDWSRKALPEEAFSVPDGYSIREPSFDRQAIPGAGTPSQR